MGAVKALTGDGLFIGQSKQFMQLLQDLAADADAASAADDSSTCRREVDLSVDVRCWVNR